MMTHEESLSDIRLMSAHVCVDTYLLSICGLSLQLIQPLAGLFFLKKQEASSHLLCAGNLASRASAVQVHLGFVVVEASLSLQFLWAPLCCISGRATGMINLWFICGEPWSLPRCTVVSSGGIGSL